MNYGFLIRNDRCIGCHACSTACKSENAVPLGVHRTWVKSVETGAFPNVGRHFQVTRCNHCANPPCVRICPTSAMYRRDDGIVEFDGDRCIGCKACLQACPYDAIHIDPESGTAAKCHFCAHRVELDLEPACVVVCPEHAIVSGDMDDPDSEISRQLARYQTTVRKPEQGTVPKLFYVDGEDAALHPTATDAEPAAFAWAESLDRHRVGRPRKPGGTGVGRPQDGGPGGPIHIGRGRMAGGMIRTFYNVQHTVPWHWPVPAYLVTKAVAAGTFLVLALGYLLERLPFDPTTFLAAGLVTLLATAATTGLLVADLERPERFVTVLTRPQWRSWLVRGAYLLVAFSLVTGVWWALEGAVRLGWAEPAAARALRPWALAVGAVLAVGVTTYTGFLFGQAEGRDLWQSPLLPMHLLVQAAVAGAAAFLILGAVVDLPPEVPPIASATLGLALLVDLLAIFFGELGMPHASDTAAAAAHAMRRGRYRHHFWWGAVAAGHVAPLALLALSPGGAGGGWGWLAPAAGLLALAGLYLYEHAFVFAAQDVPNS